MKFLPLFSLFSAFTIQSYAVLSVSDIMFVGYSAEGATEDFTFLTFVELNPGTELRFSDYPWTGSAFDTANGGLADGEIVWTATGTVSAGTVVQISMDSTNSFAASASLGSASGSFGTASGLSTTGEIIFAYQGSLASPSFIHGVNYRGVYDTPSSGDTVDSLLPSTLNVTNGNVVMLGTSPDNAQVTDRDTAASLDDYKALISDANNWTTYVDDEALDTTAFTIAAVPEPETYGLISGLLLLLGVFGYRYRKTA